MPTFTSVVQHFTGGSIQGNTTRHKSTAQELKRNKILTLFTYDRIFLENREQYTNYKKLSMNLQSISMQGQYRKKDKKIKCKIISYDSLKSHKYLGIYLIKNVQNLFIRIYKFLIEKF